MPWGKFEEAKKQAIKILGKDAKMPKEKADFVKIFTETTKLIAAFEKSRTDLEAKILAMDNNISAVANAIKQTEAIFDADDYGLDPKKKDDLKKIKDAQDLIGKFLDQMRASTEAYGKDVEELDKHVIQLRNYKAPPFISGR